MTTPDILKIEKSLNASADLVWRALTDPLCMKDWYFDISAFKPEVGFKFQFTGKGKEGESYTHLCEITEVVPGKKLSYNWEYEGYPGKSIVTFELFPDGTTTRLTLTHAGLHTFPATPAFDRSNFVEGWTYIIGISLADYVAEMKQ